MVFYVLLIPLDPNPRRSIAYKQITNNICDIADRGTGMVASSSIVYSDYPREAAASTCLAIIFRPFASGVTLVPPLNSGTHGRMCRKNAHQYRVVRMVGQQGQNTTQFDESILQKLSTQY